MKRSAVAFATLCLLVGQLVVATGASGADPSRFTATPLTPDTTFVGAKSPSGYLAQTDPSLLGRTDAAPVNIMIKFDFDATASYTGNVNGLAATSPAVTGKKLKVNEAAVGAYEQYTRAKSQAIQTAITRAVPSAKLGEAFLTAFGGVRATVPANKVAALLKVAGVAAVQKDKLEKPLTDVTPGFIGATSVWPMLGGQDHAGAGVIVGVLDTGIWPEHPSFADTHGLAAPPAGIHCEFGDGSDVANLGPTFTCNHKLIGAYAKTDGYMAIIGAGAEEFCNNTTHKCSARDSEGHGTHTTSTAAGDRVNTATLYGVNRGPISGIAPGAWVIMYRVCLAQGCFSSDSISAVQQAITDGVDVINYSISGGAQPYSDPVELAFLDAFNAGISVNASAGNSGPGAGTAAHGGPWVTTVGASTSNRFFTSTLHLTADGGATFDMPGVTITNGITSSTPVVLAQSIAGEDVLCQTPLVAGSATGKIVACQRGTNARVDKGYNLAQGGAAGMILYNPIKQDVETDNHWLPAIHVDGPSTDLLTFINGHTNVKATWAQGIASPTRGDVMAAFSSRGPDGDFIKPDITAPGIQVLAGMTPQPTGITNGPPGNLYQAIAGTSMSSPHAAGASALVKAAHPTWTPAIIKSALMTSAAQDVVKEDGLTPFDPFDAGAGGLRVGRAVNPTLVFNERYSNFVASAADPLHRINLNIPSIDATTMPGTISTTRTAINVSGRAQVLRVFTQAPAGAVISVGLAPGTDKKFISVGRNRAIKLYITISAPGLANGQYFGRITLDPMARGSHNVTIPVAFVKQQGAVTLTNTCAPTTIARRSGRARCDATVSNLSAVAANVRLRVTGKGLRFTQIMPPASAIDGNQGAKWSGTLTPAVPPQVASIAPTTGPDGGYLALSVLGVPPVAGVGDDTITNFNVPTFYYGGEPYTRIGVVSNGYIVVGGGDSGDIVFTPQHFPVAARPNNTVAPLWTDLNPPGGGAIRVASLSGGPNDGWVVVDWGNVKNFGNATTHSFEVWFRIQKGTSTGPASEAITYSYGPNLTAPGDGPGLGNAGSGDPDAGVNWGAENRDGTSGLNIASAPANGSEYLVTLTPPTAGGTASIKYTLSALRAGHYRSIASMTSNVTPGTTQVVQPITVTP
ncbi:MAG: S8 family serine peptidase [Chloroflexota bacterium]|nr:S8 family serine peptidase [Chloroflexota bacterium]